MSMINAQRHDDGKLEFSLLMWLAFAVFFVAIAFMRLVPRAMRPRVGGHDDGKSIFAAAKAATYNSIPFAFMGGVSLSPCPSGQGGCAKGSPPAPGTRAARSFSGDGPFTGTS